MLKDDGLEGRRFLKEVMMVCLSGCISMGDSLMGKLWAGRLGPLSLMLGARTRSVLSHGWTATAWPPS